MDKPSLPKGTRDFGPQVMAKRQFIFNTIRGVFQKFGFQPLETPAMENLSTLTGKYGEEGDQLLFRVLESGDFMKGVKNLKQRLEDIEFTLMVTSSELREFFNAIHLRVGSNKNVSLKELIPIIEKEIKSLKPGNVETKVSLKEILMDNKDQVGKSIIEWLSKPNEGSNGIEMFIDFFTRRNRGVQDLQSEIIRNEISEKGLRYDLTVPFARYVVMNRNEVSFPFKRYQIQPVWRADRPQKGRYREFYQCDADVVGTNSLICEAEIILMIKETFNGLGITDYSIKINHRGILNGVAEVIGAKGNETALFVAIDKLDKIGEEKVKDELRTKGFNEDALTTLFKILNVKGSITNKMAFLSTNFETCADGQKGLRDLREVFNLLESYGADESNVDFDVTLARGLSYYTGCIFEVKINNVSIGSVSGGGRYDNLTQAFGDKENLSGVGFSFGVDRIYDAMEELKLFPKDAQVSSKVLVCHLDEPSMQYGLSVLTKLRAAGIASEIYPDTTKLKKQLEYANKKMIPFTITIGSDEMASEQLSFKNMENGEQSKLNINEIISKIRP